MKHPDEHSLELFAVGSRRLGDLAPVIKEHCDQCPHCRRIVEEKRNFYSGVGSLLDERSESFHSHDNDLLATSLLARREEQPVATPPPDPGLPFHQDALRFVRRHPVAASSGFLAGLALLAWLVLTPGRNALTDTEPRAARINFVTSSVDAFNKEDQQLWSKPLADPLGAQKSIGHGTSYVVVWNPKGDGHREVALTVPLADSHDPGPSVPVVNFISGSNTLAASVTIGHEVKFGSRTYLSQFSADAVTTFPLSPDGPQLLLAFATHFRSPVALVVFGPDHNIIGEYWHYGHLAGLTTVPGLLGRKQGAVLVIGYNDAADSVGVRYAMAAVLAPEQIVNREESNLTRGFGYSPSSSELMYLRFPDLDVAQATGESPEPTRVMYKGDDQLTLLMRAPSFGIDYVVSMNMEVLSARPLPEYAELHARLRKAGKIHSAYDEKYIEGLRKRVQYWNGRGWQSGVTMMGGTNDRGDRLAGKN
jgi:hypothetical protein